MKGVNKVLVSGNVTSDINFSRTRSGLEVCSFVVCSERSGGTYRAYPKINVYLEKLVEMCRSRLSKGTYVIVEGELMNRDGRSEELTEVRARDIVFIG